MADEIQKRPVIDDPYRRSLLLKGSHEYLQLVEDAAAQVMDKIQKAPPEITKIAGQFLDATKALDEALVHNNEAREDFAAKVKLFLTDIRATRMSVTAETSLMLQPLKEIRQFFLGSDYADQIKRLREFVELCERLNALKESGFLDKIADTMIKLG